MIEPQVRETARQLAREYLEDQETLEFVRATIRKRQDETPLSTEARAELEQARAVLDALTRPRDPERGELLLQTKHVCSAPLLGTLCAILAALLVWRWRR